MVRRRCEACCRSTDVERIFTIWADGKYYCLHCLYRQNWTELPQAIPSRTSVTTMEEFASSWLSYVRRVESYEDPWHPSHSAIMRLAHIARLAPPPVCEVGECELCEGLRPFMRREDGDAGCIHCLMQGRVVEFEIEVTQEHAAA